MLSIAVIGHNEFTISLEERLKLTQFIEELIINDVSKFNFSSRSRFVYCVWEIVSELQYTKFSHVKMVAYNTKNEVSILAEDKEKQQKALLSVLKKEVKVQYFDQVIESERSYKATKNTYIERNKDIIDNSDVCLFYYDPEYKPPMRKRSKQSISPYQPQSGTKIAYEYAKRKNKKIYNVFDLLKKD